MKTERNTADYRLQLSSPIRLRIGIFCAGAVGLMVFGFLMSTNIEPGRTGGGVAYADGFSSLINMITIPGFLLSGAIVVFAANELYKAYRSINSPDSYGIAARRARRLNH